MHSAGLELTKLTYTRLEDNLIRHRGDRLTGLCMLLCVIFFFLCVVFVLQNMAKHSSPSRGCRRCHLPFRVVVVFNLTPAMPMVHGSLA